MTNGARAVMSGRRETASGTQVRYPTKDDLLAPLIAAGTIAGEQDMLELDPTLTEGIFRQWAVSGTTACLYANMLSGPANDGLWAGATLAAETNQERFDGWLQSAMQRIATKDIGLLTFPYVETEQGLAKLLGQLARSPDWWWEDRARPRDRVVPLGLRWALPDGVHVSWVLGFAPFDWLPYTRRAPYTALVLRAKPDANTVDEEDEGPDGLRGVHLAHVPHTIPGGEKGGSIWSKTEQRKRTLLWADLTAEGRRISHACHCDHPQDVAGQKLMRDAWTLLAPSAKAKVTYVMQRTLVEDHLPAPGRRD